MKRCKWKNVTFKVEQKLFSIGLLKPWKEQNEVKPQSGRYKTRGWFARSHFIGTVIIGCALSLSVSNKAPFYVCIGQTNWLIWGDSVSYSSWSGLSSMDHNTQKATDANVPPEDFDHIWLNTVSCRHLVLSKAYKVLVRKFLNTSGQPLSYTSTL